MPTTVESEKVNEEERTLQLEQEKRDRTTAVTKTRHTLERLNASGEDSGSIENGIETLWKVLDALLTVMEELQGVYLRLGDNENKKAVGHKVEGPEKEVNAVIKNAERGIKHILEKKKNMQMQLKRHCCSRACLSHLLHQRIRPPTASRQIQFRSLRKL